MKFNSKKTKKRGRKRKNIVKQAQESIELLFTYRNEIDQRIIKYNDNKSNLSDLQTSCPCHYNELMEIYKLSSQAYLAKNNLLKKNNLKHYFTETISISEDLSRNASKYIQLNYKIMTSNAFLKLWELLSLTNILPNKSNLKFFSIAEAPGQFIHCLHHYIGKKLKKVKKLDWRANSLNPYNEINKAKYEKIFSDDYGYIGSNPDKWLWGKDNTGDITNPDNLRWYRQYVKKWKVNLDLVTGDGGMMADTLLPLQLLDYSQMCMVMAVSTKGSNCIIKHFTPRIHGLPESYNSAGFFIGYLYIYSLMFSEIRLIKPIMSSPNSGEFYVVGYNFLGISDQDFEALISKIPKFKINQCIFPRKKIPISFSYQVIEFVKEIENLIINHYKLQTNILKCFDQKDTNVKNILCNLVLNKSNITRLKNTRTKKWIEINEFE